MNRDQPADAYLSTKVLTASPEELRLMLLDGAIKFARQGRDGLAEGNFEACHQGYSRCRAILLELISSMRTEVDPDLCSRLRGLYTFMYRELLESSLVKDLARADKVIELLEYDRESWTMLMDQLSRDKLSAAGAHALVAGRASHQPEYTPLSVSG
ncbi:MAG: flagellar export chaperone FliS [Phycisphaerales bacterium]